MKMPIYEYRCQSCGHELEKLQRLSDPVLTDCPDCGKAQLKRLISAAGFRLKGAGWYETDFKQGNQRNLADSSAEKSDSGNAAGKAKESGVATPSASGAGGDAKSSGASTTAASSASGTSQSSSEGSSKSSSESSSKSEGGSSGKSASGSTSGAGSAAKTA
jgi:putative FmdB family regulatory protein